VICARGAVHLGSDFAVRGRVARAELGALPGARLSIGDRAFVNQGASLVAELSIEIGDDLRMGDFAAIYDSNYHPVEEGDDPSPLPVSIGDNVWLGRGAVVLPGTHLGDHVVVAALSVVSGEVPDRTLVAGAPARPVRTLRASPGWRRG
jgi:acetyltransferase-like isoleucine patch superfamily enzyme